MATEEEGPQPGDWVAVYGQVLDQRPQSGRPEDIAVEMFSIGTQYVAVVRRDRVRKIDPPPGIAERCPSLWSEDQGDTLMRCSLHRGHMHAHRADNGKPGLEGYSTRWEDAHTFGYIEERS